MTKQWTKVLRRIDDYRWELPPDYKAGMRVPGMVYLTEHMLDEMEGDQAIEQVANVAFLPGIVGRSLAMPDIHWGYGFAIGGVAATRVEDGVVSPGGVGFDINCGTRLLWTSLTEAEVRPHLAALADALFRNIPSGLGSKGKLRVSIAELDDLLERGAAWAVEKGFGVPDDLDVTESRGCLPGADATAIGDRAKARGLPQLGTLGSGNHFLEVQAVDAIYDADAARVMGVTALGQVVLFIHTGSRGLGHQTCQDHLRVMEAATRRYDIVVPDRQLACAPVGSPEGQSYLAAMAGAANYAWVNRQCITHWCRESFEAALKRPWRDMGLQVVYDVAHNIAKLEDHVVDGRRQRLCVHRKGATRAFAPGHPEVPTRYREVGQPVLIPGDMGRYSYLLAGAERAMAETFGSTCHGAGRLQSRGAAKRSLRGVDIAGDLERRGIVVRVADKSLLAEEASEAYKDVSDVVEVVHGAGISRRVARMRPLAVIKG